MKLVRYLRKFFAALWGLLEPFWLLMTTPFDMDPLIATTGFKIMDFVLDVTVPELPCLVARIVWKDGEVWSVCSLDGVHWYRDPEGAVVHDPARGALVEFYTVCCEITTYIEEGKRGSR